MTDRKQPHPQRCETCRHYQTRFEYGNKKICTIIKERAPGSYQIGIPYHIDIVGCASHSSASSQRIEQAIKELEKLANEEERLKKESKTNEPWMGHAYANSAYLKAIAILREGAK